MRFSILIALLLVVFTEKAFSQTPTSTRVVIEFIPPLDQTILDRLKRDTTNQWVNFIRVNYILYYKGQEIHPMDLKALMLIDDRIKGQITIARIKND